MTDQVRAVRVEDLVIDADTGEILSERNVGIDELCLRLKDGQEQEKNWKAHNGLLKAAIGKKLDDNNVRKALTPYGTAAWQTRITKSAPVQGLKSLAERYGLTDVDIETLAECVAQLDPKKLDQLRREEITAGQDDDVETNADLVAAIDDLIQEKASHYVQLWPLRRDAPVLQAVELTGED